MASIEDGKGGGGVAFPAIRLYVGLAYGHKLDRQWNSSKSANYFYKILSVFAILLFFVVCASIVATCY